MTPLYHSFFILGGVIITELEAMQVELKLLQEKIIDLIHRYSLADAEHKETIGEEIKKVRELIRKTIDYIESLEKGSRKL